MPDNKKYIVTVVGVIKKNGVLANAGEEVTADQFNNFEERINGGYVTEKTDYDKVKKQSDEDQLKAAEQNNRDSQLIAYKKAFNVDAPASASTEEIKKAIFDNVQVNSTPKAPEPEKQPAPQVQAPKPQEAK